MKYGRTKMLDWDNELTAWTDKYRPVLNHITNNGDDKFETYGEELEYVRSVLAIEPERVWTLIEGDSGNLWITNGYHFVNRLNYFVTEVPYNGDYVEVPYMIFDDEEEFEDEL